MDDNTQQNLHDRIIELQRIIWTAKNAAMRGDADDAHTELMRASYRITQMRRVIEHGS